MKNQPNPYHAVIELNIDEMLDIQPITYHKLLEFVADDLTDSMDLESGDDVVEQIDTFEVHVAGTMTANVTLTQGHKAEPFKTEVTFECDDIVELAVTENKVIQNAIAELYNQPGEKQFLNLTNIDVSWSGGIAAEIEIAWKAPEVLQPNLIKDSLYNLVEVFKPSTSHDYGHGIVVGMLSALMATGWSYEQAIKQIAKNLPEGTTILSVPAAFQAEIEEHINLI